MFSHEVFTLLPFGIPTSVLNVISYIDSILN